MSLLFQNFLSRESQALPPDLPPVTVRRSARARRMALRLDPLSREVHLIIPERTSLKRAYDFARAHAVWIDRNLSSLPDPVPFVHGAVLPVFGKNRCVRVIQNPGVRSTRIDLTDDEIVVLSNAVDPQARLRRRMILWAQEALDVRAREKSAQIGVFPRVIRVRDTKSRWGSCSPEGDLNFSWRLIFAPVEAMDYVVAHEVAHMRHMNHGPAFWALCRDLSTDFLTGHRWMRTQGYSLMRYGCPVRAP
ncbi:MAG: M48 family metallopeptidase [Rhodospirillales bacterium]|nr:M48 family metallopeptidase [Rhodospirillales bacterium]